MRGIEIEIQRLVQSFEKQLVEGRMTAAALVDFKRRDVGRAIFGADRHGRIAGAG